MCIVLFINETTMNKETELKEIKKAIAELCEALAIAEKSNASPTIIKALKSAIQSASDEYISIL